MLKKYAKHIATAMPASLVIILFMKLDQKTFQSLTDKPSNSSSTLRLICLILTKSESTDRQTAILGTWARSCRAVVFVVGNQTTTDGTEDLLGFQKSTLNNNNYQNVHFVSGPYPEKYDYLWSKVRTGLEFVNEKFTPTQADWVIKADDDTFVFMENLKLFLHTKKTDESVWFGFYNRQFSPSYMSGGAGYIFSIKTLAKLVDNFDAFGCPPAHQSTEPEDVAMTKCLELLGVHATDSVDSNGRLQFIPTRLSDLVNHQQQSLDHLAMADDRKRSINQLSTQYRSPFDCCSSQLITVHYVQPDEFWVLEFLTRVGR